jgi:hypothetical protein
LLDVALALILLGMWVVAIPIPGRRNIRFLVVLAGLSAVFLGSYLLPHAAGTPVRIGVVGLVFVTFLSADRIGLGSMTWPEEKADRLLEQARQQAATDDPGDLRSAIALLDPVIAAPGSLDGRWRAEFRTQRRAWLTRLGLSPLPPQSRTPAESFRVVAVRWLTDLRLRRTLGYRSKIGLFEETVALRAYFEDVRSILPPGPLGPEPVARGPWIDASREAIAELSELAVHDIAAREIQRVLVSLLEVELESHLTAPTEQDAARYAELSSKANEAWERAITAWDAH